MNLHPNCSMVENDEAAVTSDEFTVLLNPKNKSSKSYGMTDNNRHVTHLKIIDENFISPIIFALKYLEVLEIQNNSRAYCNLPPEIECLASSLYDLTIRNTKITYLPNEIGKLTNLKILILSNTGLMYLPDSIGDLSSLVLLYLPNNRLKSLPATIKNLRSLKKIILTNNPYLHSIEPLNYLPILESLNAKHCSIKILPRNLSQLIDLNMSNNNLTDLTNIETLGYGNNNKKSFKFDKNSIQSIPFEIKNVTNLSLLNLNHNRLKRLPISMFNMKKLDKLYIANNNFSDDYLEQSIKIFKSTNPKLTITYWNDMNPRRKL